MKFEVFLLFCRCSLLINEHSTKRNNGQSTSPQGLSKEKNKTLLDSLSKDACAAVSLGGPATSKSGRYSISRFSHIR